MRNPSILVAICFALVSGCHRESKPETWAMGSQYLYAVRIGTDAISGPDAKTPSFDFDLHADLTVTPLQVSPQATRLSFSFANVAFTTQQDATAKARFARIAQQLQSPQTFTYVDGRQARGRIPKDAEAVTVGILRNVASHFQFPSNKASAAGSFRAEEYDATGRYLVEYSPKPAATSTSADADAQAYGRRKLKYVDQITADLVHKQLLAMNAQPPALQVSTGELTRAHGVATKVRSQDELYYELVGGRGIRSHLSVALDLKAKQPAQHIDVAGIDQATNVLAAAEPYVHSSNVFDMDAAKIGDRTFDGVISTLEALAKQRDSVELVGARNGKAADETKKQQAEQWTAGSLQQFVALSAMFRKNPDDIGRAIALVRGGSPATPTIISALGAAGTELAQVALLNLMRTDKLVSDLARESAGFSLLRTKNPSHASAVALQEMLRDPVWREHAVLGLGTFVRRFGEGGHAADMREFGDVLIAELAHCTGNRARLEVLTGLSNSGYVPALAGIRPLLGDASPDVRAEAVQAIRLMQTPEVDGLILTALNDPENKVRIGALEALENRSYTLALGQALTEHLHSEQDVNVRLRELSLIATWSNDAPTLRGAIQRAASQDTSELVRNSAQQALAMLTTH